ncbi:MAG: hypothetical protein M3Z04_22910 [Chloroflexota bacterium]|nr:hypothetical protein [Chloroflexota bacterium]
MPGLVEALAALGLQGEVSLEGRWVKVQSPCGPIYVAEAVSATQYYTWSDVPGARTVEYYPDPVTAIQAGLRRVARVCGADPPDPPVT